MDNPHQKSTHIQDIIEALCLKNPKETFKLFFPIMRNRIIVKGKPKLKKYEEHAYYFILDNHPFKEEILTYK